MTPTSEHQPNRREEHLTDAALNELVDGTLTGRDLERTQAHLAACPECEERYRTLVATVSALKSAPSMMPRRSFQLSPEQAKLPEPKPSWIDRFSEWIVPGLPAIKVATIAVALLLVSVTAFDVLTNQSGSGDLSPSTTFQREADDAAPAAEITQFAPTDMPAFESGDGEVSDSSDALQESASDEISLEEAAPATDNQSGGNAGDSQPADEPMTGAVMQQAPEAPAAAPQPAMVASPAVIATPIAQSTDTATPEPAASGTPTPESDGWRAEVSLSWWRIAELGLLMILAWLVVSWIGRSRVEKTED